MKKMSRSGRIRKKSSKFADFESPDEIDSFYKKKNSLSKPPQKLQLPPKVEESDSDSDDSDDSGSDTDIKDGSFSEDWGENVDQGDIIDDFKDEYEDDDDDEEDDLHIDTEAGRSKNNSNYSQANSVYFTEKKKYGKEPHTVKKKKSERKDKGKARFTAYMLWARATRPKIVKENPNLDFSAVNKMLGEMWNHVPYTQKHNWKRKAQKLEPRGGEKRKSGRTMISTGKGPSKGPKESVLKSALTGKAEPPPTYSKGNKAHGKSAVHNARVAAAVGSQKQILTPKVVKVPSHIVTDASPPTSFKVTGTSPIDVAAHLKLLGESLNNIGQKLKEHEGQIAVSGSLSVLLDSMLCVLGPLACLSNQLEETQGAIPEQTLSSILDNIAYIMPGIV